MGLASLSLGNSISPSTPIVLALLQTVGRSYERRRGFVVMVTDIMSERENK